MRPSEDDSEEAASTSGLDHGGSLEVAAQVAFCACRLQQAGRDDALRLLRLTARRELLHLAALEAAGAPRRTRFDPTKGRIHEGLGQGDLRIALPSGDTTYQ